MNQVRPSPSKGPRAVGIAIGMLGAPVLGVATSVLFLLRIHGLVSTAVMVFVWGAFVLLAGDRFRSLPALLVVTGIYSIGAVLLPLMRAVATPSRYNWDRQAIITIGVLAYCLNLPIPLAIWYVSRDMDCRASAIRSPPRCRPCGYDLTGNTSGRCPECGTACGDDVDARDAARRSAPRRVFPWWRWP